MMHDSSSRYGGTHVLSDKSVGHSDMFMNLSDMFDDQYKVRITYLWLNGRHLIRVPTYCILL